MNQGIFTSIEKRRPTKGSPIVWNTQAGLLLTIRDINQSKLRELRLEDERIRLRQENLMFKSAIRDRFRFGELIGKSLAMQRVYELIVSAATSDVNVLVCGESGTGKELIARTIHQVSTRKNHAFVPVNCASIPETLFEREFFGHRRGSFTHLISEDQTVSFDEEEFRVSLCCFGNEERIPETLRLVYCFGNSVVLHSRNNDFIL